jgi:hypothetical protein
VSDCLLLSSVLQVPNGLPNDVVNVKQDVLAAVMRDLATVLMEAKGRKAGKEVEKPLAERMADICHLNHGWI